jgi:hypothetical protein
MGRIIQKGDEIWNFNISIIIFNVQNLPPHIICINMSYFFLIMKNLYILLFGISYTNKNCFLFRAHCLNHFL